MDEQEKSPSGSPIYRYDKPVQDGFQPADGESHIEEISDHIEKHLGKIHMVYHEVMSHLVHIDVYHVAPSEQFPFNILVTSGMSDKPMRIPEGVEVSPYAELCILLPADWKLTQEDFNDEKNYWPVRWLKQMARFPHEFDSWLGWGHTIPNGPDAEPFAGNTKLGCMLLLPALSLSGEFFTLETTDGFTINFYCLYPLYKEEMDFKMKKGVEELIDKFEEYQVSDVVDLNRKNTCKKKGFFGF